MALPDPSSVEILKKHVLGALLEKSKGTATKPYTDLVTSLSTCRKRVEKDASDVDGLVHLVALIKAISGCASTIKERKHQTLVSELLSVKLWTAPDVVRDSVLELVANLVVANSAFTSTCMQLLIRSFVPPPAPPAPEAAADGGPWQPAEQELVVQSSVLGAVLKLLQLVPTAAANVLPVILQNMPHKLRDRDAQCLYLWALFQLAEAAAGASIKEALLTAVLEHLLTIDVEIRWEDIVEVPTGEEEDPGGSEEELEIFDLEGLNELDINTTPEERAEQLRQRQAAASGWEGAGIEASSKANAASERPPVDETANKLDSMMELTFDHLARRCEAGELRQVWQTLLTAFEHTILHTHRSKFTQFLLYYVAFQDPEPCCTSLVDFLLSRLTDAQQPSITRVACAAYLASFLARASFVPQALVVTGLQRLAGFCQEYCNSVKAMPRASSSSALQRTSLSSAALDQSAASSTHQVLYSALQATLYVLCYHMGAILGPQTSAGRHTHAAALTALVKERVAPVLYHKLAPLAVCLPSVVQEFARQAAAYQLLDLTPLLPKEGSEPRAQQPLQMFFPFDPYLLQRSSRYLQLKHTYVRWRGGHPHNSQAPVQHAVSDSDDDGAELDDEEPVLEQEESESDEEVGGSSLPTDAVLAGPKISHRMSAPLKYTASVKRQDRPSDAGMSDALSEGQDAMAVSYGTVLMGSSPMLEYYRSPLGNSPQAMSITPDGHFMQSVPGRLKR